VVVPCVCVGGWALRAGIEMTINLPGHLVSVIQCYLAMNDTHFNRVVYSFASFPSDWMWCLLFILRAPLFMIVCVWLFWSGSVVLRMSLLYLFWMEGSHPSKGAGWNTHKCCNKELHEKRRQKVISFYPADKSLRLSSLFIFDMEALIAQLKGCLLDCFDWESNNCAWHWCSLVGWCDTLSTLRKI